jgi:hypothetical protein
MVDICKINDNGHYNFVPAPFQNDHPKLFEMDIGVDSNVTVALTQPSTRGKG